MLLKLLLRMISFGITDAIGESKWNRLLRINLFFLILIVLLLISTVWALVEQRYLLLALNGSFLALSLLAVFIIPKERKTDLYGYVGQAILTLVFLSGYLFDFHMEPALILAFYLLFPLASAGLNGRKGLWFPIAMGAVVLVINFIPDLTHIRLSAMDTVVFFTIYILMIVVAFYVEQSNSGLLFRLQESRDKVEKEIFQKDEFISRLSHKLRTSLSNITLISNLVNDSRLTSDQKELIETLKASTNNLIQDVNNIVEIASPGIQDYKKSIISFDLKKVLDEALDILRTGNVFKEEIIIENQDNTANYLIGDPSLVRSLVVNIIKGMGIYQKINTPLILTVEPLNETPSQIRLAFRFSIQTDLQENLEEHVSGLKRKEPQQATSLANASNLLKESESGISFESSGIQASLSFFQDFAKDATRTVATEKTASGKTVVPAKGIPLKNANVLLVEDNEINQKIVILSLNKRVDRIDVAGNGKEALEYFGQKKYDIILMDIMMPVMDGITATKKIREIESTTESRVPIITITANALAGDRDNCLAAGADDYIAKPFQADVLIKKMKNLLA